MNIRMNGIHKAFGANCVLSGVDFELLEGEVHALMGENGAGKSTLMNILTGLHSKDKGIIFIDGKEVNFASPSEAEQYGIAFIHQELNILPDLSVLENLFLGKEITTRWGFLNSRSMKTLANEQMRKLSLSLPLDQPARACSVGQQQMIEIAKALMTDAKVIIMDEPTAALTEREIRKLFEVIPALKKEGVSIVYISHRMEEIFEICDRITIIRDGMTVDTQKVSLTDFDDVVKKMVGRELADRFPQRNISSGEIILQVKDASKRGVFHQVSFSVRAGEILGISGLMGSGRTEIMRAIYGLDPLDEGEVRLNGVKVSIRHPYEAVKLGIGFITEDRKDEGLLLDFSVRENMVLPSLFSFRKRGLINERKEKDIGALIIGALNNGLNLLGVSSFYQLVVKGIVIVIAVLMDRKKAA